MNLVDHVEEILSSTRHAQNVEKWFRKYANVVMCPHEDNFIASV
jgi:hypothetical protein